MSDEISVIKKITYSGGVYRIPIPKIFVDNMKLTKGDSVKITFKDRRTLLIEKST
ncbi:MAG: hypothetical protein JXA54_06835 [Candidatus Heimdallarchaeota archaeon]|nr:hypothetical protein [Candidatus Heimdallarchaeota archaeon]